MSARAQAQTNEYCRVNRRKQVYLFTQSRTVEFATRENTPTWRIRIINDGGSTMGWFRLESNTPLRQWRRAICACLRSLILQCPRHVFQGIWIQAGWAGEIRLET